MTFPDIESSAKGIHFCIDNATSFLNSAEILLIEKEYRISYLLTLYALEEMGKVILIFNLPHHTATKEKWKKWQRRFKDHEEKFWFSRDLDDFALGKLASKSNIQAKKSAKEKQAISYVDIEGSSFIPPLTVSKKQAQSIYDKAIDRLKHLKYIHPLPSVTRTNIEQGKKLEDKDLKEFIEKLTENPDVK